MFPWRQGGSAKGSLEPGGPLPTNGVRVSRLRHELGAAGQEGAEQELLGGGGPWGMNSLPGCPGSEPCALPARVGFGQEKGGGQSAEPQTWGGHTLGATPPGAEERSWWVREASRQRPLVPAADSARRPRSPPTRALSRAGLRKHLLPRTSGRPASPPGGFLVYRPPALIPASLTVATPPISSDRSRSSSFILAPAHAAAPPPHPTPSWSFPQA